MWKGHNLKGCNRDRRLVLGWMTLTGGVLVLLFWILYFSRAVDLGQDDPLVHAFESAFPLADAVFAAALFAAAYHLLKGQRPGPFFLVMAGTMSLYLGVLDATFYVGHGIHSQINLDAVISLTVNALCIGAGIIALRFGWRYWSAGVRPSRSSAAWQRRDLHRTSTEPANWPPALQATESKTDEQLMEVVA